MAKARTTSKHSRAARRDISPSANVDKSLLSAPRAETTVIQRDSILSERANAGISKKQPKPKNLSRAQRQRQQKGMEKAEMVVDQLENKVAKSVKRGNSVQARRADWEDTNRKSSKFEALQLDSAPKSRESKPARVTQNPVADNHAGNDEDEEIT
ncbi:Alb1 domain-containing protein [Aspergillus glaucus CBS 516.65]|uniref:Ribosome biogenesis protein Alb1 n=1 Tax=Aspergillus glaucus CBS 516.65 TaxID=1160497 RepID=A0A1L9V8Y4_ASPGL|nr:hypothetical protein ASPGLDRAFT_869904 [Aspergillus glaucus CBS 516.65]OJJ80397.1 hypothetical protein ASPGLDRAFT_869904 [Aspergillus glaucus CBS 516.65]